MNGFGWMMKVFIFRKWSNRINDDLDDLFDIWLLLLRTDDGFSEGEQHSREEE